MTPATTDTDVKSAPTAHDRAIDTARQIAHLSHEAQRLGSLAADAVEDRVHAAKRAIKSVERSVEELGDRKEELAHRVKRQPLKAVALAVSAGLVLGVAFGWICGRQTR
jgi:hypothetical protein